MHMLKCCAVGIARNDCREVTSKDQKVQRELEEKKVEGEGLSSQPKEVAHSRHRNTKDTHTVEAQSVLRHREGQDMERKKLAKLHCLKRNCFLKKKHCVLICIQRKTEAGRREWPAPV